jgi:predicted DNA-binding transcriptional regulator AlpA
MPVDADLWTAEETAAYLRRPLKTLYRWRYVGKGPRALKVGRSLLYKAEEVRAWVDEQA